MEVVKDGKVGNPENWKTVVSCSKKDAYDSVGCGAELEVRPNDLILMYFKGSHSNHYYTAVKCPQCGKYDRVRDVPKPIWEKIHTNANKAKAIFDGFSDR